MNYLLEINAFERRMRRVPLSRDAQLLWYKLMHLANLLIAAQKPAGPSREEIVAELLNTLTVRTDDGLRISDATVRKIREIAKQRGFLPVTPV